MLKKNLRKVSSLLLAVSSVAAVAQGQTTVTLYGALSNFDVLNDSGHDAYGFEIEIQGVTSIGGSFSWNRYGAPNVVPFNGGVYVRYMAKWDPATGKFTTATPPAVNMTPTNGHQCVLGTLNYDTSGCEHFGVWTMANPTKTVYRWMFADPNNPGSLVSSSTPVAIPAPVWNVLPPAKPADPPIVAADVVAPIAPKPAETYGDAQWMKVYKTEHDRQVGLDELLADNPVVPEQAAQVETSWYLVQAKVGGNGKRNQRRNQGSLGNGKKAVVRRYEFFKFTGTYDAVTHEAVCADLLCNAPADSEVGDFIGAQNAAGNLNVPAQQTLTVTVSGNGQVDGAPGAIRCPGACSATVNVGTAFTLTAKANSGSVFAGWTGACAGTSPTCTVELDSTADTTATFLPLYTLSVSRSGKGLITSNPAGINCGLTKGGNCSTKYAQGTAVTLTAAPDAGAVWSGWAGACSGTSLTCTVPMSKDTSVQGNFK
ncbi:MAG: hypothetical protein IT168_01335 [Bryobacterales bacterium]|nr:hypothetical protein [Bryobacterales bacterium]